MVYWTAIKQKQSSEPTYHNETFRAKYGYKEMHVHNAPKRKNKDFKPVLYGDFIGMLNFKLSEPWALIRHAKDLWHEDHQMPIQWAKKFIHGAFVGAYFSMVYNLYYSNNEFVEKKSRLATNHFKNPFGLKIFSQITQNFARPALYGGALYLSYQMLWDLFTHHREALQVPEVITHAKVWGVMVPAVTLIAFGPKQVLPAILLSLFIGFPIFSMVVQYRKNPQTGPMLNPHVYYQDGVSQAEKDYYEHLDYVEDQGFYLENQYAYNQTSTSNGVM